MAISAFGPFVRFFMNIVLLDSFSTDLLVFENCLLEFKKNRLSELRAKRSSKHELLTLLDDRYRQSQSEYERTKSNEAKLATERCKHDKETHIQELKELDNQIGILDLTIDKFWDEIFATYDWIIEKEKINSAFLNNDIKVESEFFKTKIDTLLDRYIQMIEQGFAIHILRGRPLKIESKALHKVFEKLKSNEELLIITVIGEQSSAKSSLLNALFGCDFRTSAGRCTVGIYMNFVYYKARNKNSVFLNTLNEILLFFFN